jgi:hypothetical protein
MEVNVDFAGFQATLRLLDGRYTDGLWIGGICISDNATVHR